MTVHGPSVTNWGPSTLKVAQEVDKAFPRRDWTSTYPGHGEGRGEAQGRNAIDFMVSPLRATVGGKIAAYLIKHAARLGVRYIIWDGRIWYRKSNSGQRLRVWLPYFNRNAVNADGSPNPSKRHTNHVHVSTDEDFTYKPPTTVATKPPVQPLVSLRRVQSAVKAGKLPDEGDVGLDVAQYQAQLNIFGHGYELLVDGVPGPKTRRSGALAQLKIAQDNGASSLDKGDAWPESGHHADLDGIPGAELFRKLGIDNEDDNPASADPKSSSRR